MIARMGMGLVSYADLQRWPDDGHQYELYDGEVRVVPSATNRHQLVAQRLYDELRAFERVHGGRILMAPSDVVFNQYNVLQPDLLYFTQTRKHLVQLDTPTDASPDLAIEILSPSTSAHDRTRKQAMYARFGVGEYWIVDPAAETIEIFVLEHGFYRFASMTGRDVAASSPTIDGLGVDTSQVFDIG
jgi:Uma2 family endonuclease